MPGQHRQIDNEWIDCQSMAERGFIVAGGCEGGRIDNKFRASSSNSYSVGNRYHGSIVERSKPGKYGLLTVAPNP